MQQKFFPRLWQHIIHPRFRVERYLPTAQLQQLGQQIALSESKHFGEIRFVVESGYPLADLLAGVQPRQKAQQWFAHLGIWDTEYNTGVLVYISFADHAVEIIADRGIAQRVAPETWQTICNQISQSFRNQNYVDGLTQGLAQIDAILLQECAHDGDPNRQDLGDELPNDVMVV